MGQDNNNRKRRMKHNEKGNTIKATNLNNNISSDKNNENVTKVMCFQDWFPQSPSYHSTSLDNNSTGATITNKENRAIDLNEAFFELANAPIVSYRLLSNTIRSSSVHQINRKRAQLCDNGDDDSSNSSSSSSHTDGTNDESKNSNNNKKNMPAISVTVKQDSACGSHTGGIVWETSYLLATFLLERYREKSHSTTINDDRYALGRVLELGSGCGMLGLILAASGLCQVVVSTETTEVMHNLRKNIQSNIICRDDKSTSSLSASPCCPPGSIVPRQLRWDNIETDIESGEGDLSPHSFDTIIGTDVVFTTTLVKPLLQTMRKMSHKNTLIYLCLQIRCADSHGLLLKEAPKFGFCIQDCSEQELKQLDSCSWGLEMECKLLRFVVVDDVISGKDKKRSKQNKKEKKKKDKHEKKKKRKRCDDDTDNEGSKKKKKDKHDEKKKQKKCDEDTDKKDSKKKKKKKGDVKA
mmetsp:Transcript_13555/g.20224  ORF Transcript_13555/g.20224 Transcript_13555/m.20224 type:complete len:467 (-) Transcript_13555:638-2038(-)